MIENNYLPVDKNLLIIGGSGRNVGKTTLALTIINKISKETKVLGLKVSTHKHGEELFHGNHTSLLSDNYRISVETRMLPNKDTALMLDAGAGNAYFIEASSHKVMEAYEKFKKQYNEIGLPVVCESRSLRKHIKPGLFILLVNDDQIKHDTNHYMSLADHVHIYDNNIMRLNHLADVITFGPEGWEIND
jgi:hypothetical protein